MDQWITIRIPDALNDRLEKAAKASGYSKSDYVRFCLEKELGNKALVEVLIRDPEPLKRFLRILGKKLEGG